MKYVLKKLLILLTVLLLLGACSGILKESNDSSDSEITVDQDVTLNDLSDTNHFMEGALEHIFIGEINRHGDAVGFHYDRFPGQKGRIIYETKSKPDEHGVYESKVKVDDTEKTSNGGKSSCLPDNFTPQHVVDTLNTAYENRMHLSGNTSEGLSAEGIVVHMYLD